MSRHFLLNPNRDALTPLQQEEVAATEKERQQQKQQEEQGIKQAAIARMQQVQLTHTHGRVIVAADRDEKNWHTFEDGTKIRRERAFNDFNRRVTEPVNGICISGENIPAGTPILCHQNAFTPSTQIFNHSKLSGQDEATDIKYYSVPEEMCFLWYDKDKGVWNPLYPYETALRVFKPHKGVIEGIDPELLKDTLYVTSGELAGKVVKTLVACDFEVVFQNVDHKEGRIIRFRPFGDPRSKKEEEAICILDAITDGVDNGDYYVGLSVKDCVERKKEKRRMKSNKKILIPK